MFGKLIAKDRLKVWLKVISNPIEKDNNYYQACFMCVEVHCEEEIDKIQNLLKEKGTLGVRGACSLGQEAFIMEKKLKCNQ